MSPPAPQVSNARRQPGRDSPLEKKVLTMKLKEMEEMEKMARKANTSVGSLLVSTAPCLLTYRENLVTPRAGEAGHGCRHVWTAETSCSPWVKDKLRDR